MTPSVLNDDFSDYVELLAIFPLSVISMLPSEPHMIDGTAVASDPRRHTSKHHRIAHYLDVRA